MKNVLVGRRLIHQRHILTDLIYEKDLAKNPAIISMEHKYKEGVEVFLSKLAPSLSRSPFPIIVFPIMIVGRSDSAQADRSAPRI